MIYNHPNHIILFDGEFYRLFHRLNGVPFEAYNPAKHLEIGISVDEVIEKTSVPAYDIDNNIVEVVFNE